VIEVSDEVLMAYADGALDPAERRRIDLYLQNSADGRARLAPFAATRSAELAREFSDVLHWNIPEHLVETIFAAPMAKAPSAVAPHAAPKVAQAGLVARVAEFFAMPLSFGSLAAAFCSALLIGGLAGWSAHGRNEPAASAEALITLGNAAGSGLAQALETSPVKQPVTIVADGRNVSVTPTMSFVTRDKQFCRQYKVATEANAHFAGLGCRQANGEWRIEAHSTVAAKAHGNDLGRPAAANTSPVIDAVADQLIDGPALTPEAESALIAKGWHP
jgi:hypothetical protein